MHIRDEKLFETWTQFLEPGGDLSFQLVIKYDSVSVFVCVWTNPGRHTHSIFPPQFYKSPYVTTVFPKQIYW